MNPTKKIISNILFFFIWVLLISLILSRVNGKVGKGVTIHWYIGILRYHFADSIYRYRLSYVRKSLMEHAPDCAISSLPVFIFLGQFHCNQSDYKQHGGLQLRFQFGDKYKGQKSELWIYTGVIRQRPSYYYIIWVSGCCSRFLVLLNWNKSASEIHLNDFTCYPIRIQYVSQYRIPVSQYIAIRFW